MTLVRYMPSDSVVGAEHCPPIYRTELQISLAADGLPALQAVLSTRITITGEAYAESVDLAFDDDLPEPTTFDPDDVDTVQSQVFFASTGDSWNVDVGWIAMNLGGVPEGEYVYQEFESVMGALLVAE